MRLPSHILFCRVRIHALPSPPLVRVPKRASLISSRGRGGAKRLTGTTRHDEEGKKGERESSGRKIIRDTLVVRPIPETFTVENSYENRGACRKCLTNIRIMEEAFIFVPYNRKLVDETIGVLLKRAFLSIVTATLPSYGRGGSFHSLCLGSMIIARLKQTIFPDETLARIDSYQLYTRVMKITRF